MTETVDLVATGGVLVAGGTTLLMTRPLTRIVLGAVLLGNGVNLLLLSASGAAGAAPLLYPASRHRHMPDPLPQAFVLTAIVITLALTAFLAAMAYRAWQLSGSDDVQDDVEDLRVARRAEHVEERDRLRADYRERQERYRQLLAAQEAEETERGGGPAAERTGGPEREPAGAPHRERAYRQLGRARAQYREARRRARAEVRADRARQARAEEEAAEEDDPWETILGGDR